MHYPLSPKTMEQSDVILALPIRGTNSDVGGILSAMSNMNTEYERSTVMPSVIFSPASGGRQKASRLSMFSHTHGSMMFRM